MKIYTKFGDDGNTKLLGGQTVRKNDIRVAVCGTLDELNAVLGMVASHEGSDDVVAEIRLVQGDLFSIGSTVASAGAGSQMDLPQVTEADCQRLEDEIDTMSEVLKPLVNFLLPGGAPAAAAMHQARAVCRRVERQVMDLTDLHQETQATSMLKYLNRLSDWCFVAARYLNHIAGVEEPVWRNR